MTNILSMKNVEELDLHSVALKLVNIIYTLTKTFPKEELFGTTSQMRRCAVSIPANVSEGFYRNSTKDYVRFLNIANGSAAELNTLLQISKELNMLSIEQYKNATSNLLRVRKMINKLRKVLEKKIN